VKAFTERSPKRIGAVVVVVAALVVAGVLFLNRSVFEPTYTIHARLTDAAGLAKGTAVTLAGVNVGSVSGVHLEGDAVVANLAINHGVALPAHTAAAVEVETVLGVLEVALEPRSGWSHPLRAGATITDTSIPVEFQDLENTAGNLLQQSDVAAFNQLVVSLEQVTQGKESQVAAIISGLDQFTGAISSRQGQVSSLIDSADTLAATVAQRDGQLSGLVDNLSTVVQGLAQRSSQLNALIVGTDQLATETAALIGQNEPQLQGLLDHLQSVLGVLDQHQEDLAEGVSYLSSALSGFSSIGYSGPDNTPQSWGNIYANVVGLAQGYAVLGDCGALDQALNEILGPDPLPCDEQTGPPEGQSAATPSAGPGGSTGTNTGTDLNGALGSLKGGGTGGASASAAGENPLAELLSPLLGGSS
jgi:phospholipid/cholesterol/gamma-HCH transport system substrate-binding protein